MHKNIGFDEKYRPIQGACDPKIFDETFWANEEKSELYNATNIVGYYLRMIKAYIKSFDDLQDVTVKPAADKEMEENYSSPSIVISRGVLSPHNVGIMNKGGIAEIPGIPMEPFGNSHPDISYNDSKAYSDILNMVISVRVYAMTSAEAEKISILLFHLLIAASYDVLSRSFNFLIGINPPTLSQIVVEEKHSEVYSAKIEWSLDYRNDAIVMIRKNLIKYATITVRENDADRVATVSS